MKKIVDRRTLLSYGGLLGAGLVGSSSLARAATCDGTPTQTAGPFYPVVFPTDGDMDLTFIQGHQHSAKGLLVIVEGRIQGTDCNPVAGAIVEIWQATASGRYNDDRDSNPAPRDDDFQGWGRVVTGVDGKFRFKTIKPGAYPTDPSNPTGWIRPPHIHFQVTAPGAPRLVTQQYFAGEPLNDKDEILLDLRHRVGDQVAQAVVTAFTGSGTADDPLHGIFDITVGGPGERGVTPFLD